jgi:hypothetical protein
MEESYDLESLEQLKKVISEYQLKLWKIKEDFKVALRKYIHL